LKQATVYQKLSKWNI